MRKDSFVSPHRFISFGELLRYLRRRAGLTQSELSIATGYSDSQISRLEKNQRVPNEVTLAALFIPALHLEDEPAWAERLFTLAKEARKQASSVSDPASPSSIPNNLLIQLTNFIGRENEIRGIQELVTGASHRSSEGAAIPSRLMTLIGPGGIGKTRLAAEAAARLAASFPDGVWLVDLTPVTDGGYLPQTISKILGLRDQGARSSLDVLIDALHPKKVLIVLDNCEHLVQACALLAESLLRSCPDISLIATSRELLGVSGEILFQVPPLPTPGSQSGFPPDTLMQYAAVELFVSRARAVQPDFSLSPDNSAIVAQICQQLDGLPLAIELAAARVNILGVDQIAFRLADSIRLLKSSSRTASPRQQTLRATIEWSYNLLSEPERILLCRLAVFSGGWTLEAAENICSDSAISPQAVFDLLVLLAEKSLVMVEPSSQGDRRYRFLETTRQYLQEQLEESGELSMIRMRHLEYYLAEAKQAYPALVKYNPVRWLDRIESDHDNYRTALDWSMGSSVDSSHYFLLAATMGRFWEQLGYLEEGRERLIRVLSKMGAQAPALERAELLLQVAWLTKLQSNHTACRPFLQECLQILQHHYPDGLRWEADVYNIYAVIGIDTGDYRAARRYAEDALRISRYTDDQSSIAWSEQSLGWVLLRLGNYDEARVHLEEALRIRRAASRGTYATLQALGELALRQGDLDLAQRYLMESLSFAREGQNRWEIGVVLGLSGWVELARGNLPGAKNLFLESLEARRGIGDKGGMAWCFERLAQCLLIEGCPQQAATLFGCAEVVRLSINESIDPDFRAEYEQCVKELQEQLGNDHFLTIWEQGKAMEYEDILNQVICLS